MTQAAQQADLDSFSENWRQMEQDWQQQEQRYFEIAGRLHSLVIDGKLDPSDFEDVLYSFGILTDWKRSQK